MTSAARLGLHDNQLGRVRAVMKVGYGALDQQRETLAGGKHRLTLRKCSSLSLLVYTGNSILPAPLVLLLCVAMVTISRPLGQKMAFSYFVFNKSKSEAEAQTNCLQADNRPCEEQPTAPSLPLPA